MKKLIIILSIFTILFSSACKSQVYVGVGAGLSNKAPVMELQVGIESPQTQFQLGFISHISSKVADGTSFYGKFSPVFHFSDYKIIPGFGYSYNLKSTDNKELNGDTFLFSMYGYKTLGEAECFIGINYIDKTTFITIGMRGLF